MYNFFGDSALDNLWKYLIDDDQHKIWDSKYAPLIHEVSDKVVFQSSEALLFVLESLNACMSPLLGQSTDSGL